VICERYRESLMALLDNELPESERHNVMLHLQECHECRTEYEELRNLVGQLNTLRFPAPKPEFWDDYYQGVCERMQRSARWGIWGAAAVGLLILANVLFFAFPASGLCITLGSLALVSGAATLWLTYYCNCS